MRTTIRWPLAISIALAAGCGGGGGAPAGGTGPATGTSQTYDLPPLPGEVSCWAGKGGIEFATGLEEDALEVYVRRGWDAATYTFTEDTLNVVKGNASRSWQTITMAGPSLTVEGKYPGGTWTGTGAYAGDAPSFTTWFVDLTLDAGSTVHSEYAAVGAGVTLTSMVSGPDGTQLMRFTVELAQQEAAACDAVFAKHAPVP